VDYLWTGRLKGTLHHLAKRLTFSIDSNLILFDISGSIVHAEMLVRQKIITRREGQQIISGLKKIQAEVQKGIFIFKQEDEDIHTAVERRLVEIIGETGGKLHTARSRNDQIVLDEKLYLKQMLPEIMDKIRLLQKTLLNNAEKNFGFCMPEMTHFQPAQPVLFSHHLMAYISMFERDKERISDALNRIDVSPLGACACAGTSFGIDTQYTAKKLGFSRVFSNSIDAVSDRDFILETISHLGILMVHLSRMSEELIFWNSSLVGFVELPDEFCTGSSIMPQKKNPDVLELIRGKTSTVIANLTGIFSLTKGLVLSYNRDMQEDKRFLFETCDISYISLIIMAEILKKSHFNFAKMEKACRYGYIEATDIAEFLAKKGIPFRKAHHIVSNLTGIAFKKGIPLSKIDEKILKEMGFDKEGISFIKKIDAHVSIKNKKSDGSTGIKQVQKEIEKWKKRLI